MPKKSHRFKYYGMKENTCIPIDSETNIKKIEEKEMIKNIGTHTVYAIGMAMDSIGIIYGKLPERVKKQFIYLSQVVFKCVYEPHCLSEKKILKRQRNKWSKHHGISDHKNIVLVTRCLVSN